MASVPARNQRDAVCPVQIRGDHPSPTTALCPTPSCLRRWMPWGLWTWTTSDCGPCGAICRSPNTSWRTCAGPTAGPRPHPRPLQPPWVRTPPKRSCRSSEFRRGAGGRWKGPGEGWPHSDITHDVVARVVLSVRPTGRGRGG